MDPTTAQTVYWSIMIVSLLVWFTSLHLAMRMGGRKAQEEDPFAPFTQLPEEPDDSAVLTGEKTVRGTCEDVSVKLGQALLQTGVPGMFSSLFEIKERTAERLHVEKTGPLICNQPSGMYFSEVEFLLSPAGESQVVVQYRLGFERLVQRVRTVALSLILGLGLPVILIVGGIIWFLVVNNPNPVVRWQVFQTLQIAHVLWPPFLILGMYRSGRRHGRTFIANVLSILELATVPGHTS